MTDPQTAAYFRLEGTLLRRPTLATPAWLASQAQTLSHRVMGLGAVLAAAPLSLGSTPLTDRTLASRMAWAALREVSEDRLVILGREYYESWLDGNITSAGQRLLDRARTAGHRIVLVSDNVDVVVEHVAGELGVADVLCNRLEIRRGRATGRLVDPAISGPSVATALREHAAQHGFDLSRCAAYGHSSDDTVLLTTVGQPCAVNPAMNLRRVARDLNWPVVVD